MKARSPRWIELCSIFRCFITLRLISCGVIFKRLMFLAHVIVLLLTLTPGLAHAWSWQDLWKTPHQQRQALEQSGNYEALIESESSQWQGVGHYRGGDYGAAAESYAKSEELSSLYNQATALTQAGDYDAAIEKFDDLLSQNPEHAKALHNQNIARQLKELQQQNQQQNQDQGENQDSDQQQDQNDQQDQQDQQSDSSEQQNDPSQSNQQDQNEESESDESQQQQQAEDDQSDTEKQEQQAEQQQAEEQQEQQERAQSTTVESEEPLTEDQQAIEQWLRKIPDDPSGLLRRKLIRSHRSDYPDVRDSQSPW